MGRVFQRGIQGRNFAALPAAISGGAAYVVSKREEKNILPASAAQSRFLKRGSERLRHNNKLSCGFFFGCNWRFGKELFCRVAAFQPAVGGCKRHSHFFKELCYFRRGGLSVAVCEGFGADVANVRKGVVGFHFYRRAAGRLRAAYFFAKFYSAFESRKSRLRGRGAGLKKCAQFQAFNPNLFSMAANGRGRGASAQMSPMSERVLSAFIFIDAQWRARCG